VVGSDLSRSLESAEGFVLCFDVTSQKSFNLILIYKKFIEKVKQYQNAPMVLVGTHCKLRVLFIC
jgi:GTPase SAR1 family protein